jgi:hypothetical protein
LYAQDNSALNNTTIGNEIQTVTLQEQEIQQAQAIVELKQKIETLNNQLQNNILIKRYSNYVAYRQIANELHKLEDEYARYIDKEGERFNDLKYQLSNKIRIKKNELELIAEYKDSPIGNLINPPEIDAVENVTNPFGVINALSDIKKLQTHKNRFQKVHDDVEYVRLNH